ncbi:long chain fatty acid CoA ligase-like protein [Leptotrombidium deliense]|uniref:long-chain-fatty-acid--CoA ligase n=1 Tax=Leptotrombidium deliense TaxID=299467 RepID=A0A443SEB8_9ACAR|nr:long chain fatty acid CoA ligase-like protein [Leptotrombidium deliense]
MSFKAIAILGLLKTLVLIYDIISMPIYFIIQKPWRVWKRMNRARARQEDPKDPYSPYVRVEETVYELVPRSMMNAETIGEVFQHACDLYAKKRCYGFREVFAEQEELQPNGKKFRKLVMAENYTWINYEDVNQDIDLLVKGFLSVGVKPGDKVVIFSETRPEWMLCSNALFRMGAVLVTLYANLGEDGVIHGINECETDVIITSADLVPKLVKIEKNLQKVKTIIYVDSVNKKKLVVTDEAKERYKIVSYNEVCKEGKRMKDEDMAEQIGRPKQDDLALLMYTSGSTGNPKAVMITHRNFLAAFQALVGTLLREYPLESHECYIAYLPLAHIFELMMQSLMFLLGIPIGYSSIQTMLNNSTAVKRGCKGDIGVLKPTIMAAVPLVLDRIRKGVTDIVHKQGPVFEQIFDFAVSYKRFWVQSGFRTPLTNLLIFKKARKNLGGKMKLMVVGGAPLSPDTQSFIQRVFNVGLRVGYAATETCAASCAMDMDELDIGRVGPPLMGVKLRLKDWPEGNYHAFDKPNPRGEILLGGNCVSIGYYKNEEETKKNYVVEDGVRWWNTGDIGEVFEDGTVKIIDRKKDLVKLQFGEYISLGKVESELKNCPFVENICVHGDSMHTNLVALIVPNRASMKQLAKTLNKEQIPFDKLCQDSEVISTIKKALNEHALKSGLLKVEIPTDIKLVCEEWLPDSGLVTAALKIRRKQIEDFYKADIIKMYSRNGSTKST